MSDGCCPGHVEEVAVQSLQGYRGENENMKNSVIHSLVVKYISSYLCISENDTNTPPARCGFDFSSPSSPDIPESEITNTITSKEMSDGQSSTWVDFKTVGDNIDKAVWLQHQTLEKCTQSLNFFHYLLSRIALMSQLFQMPNLM